MAASIRTPQRKGMKSSSATSFLSFLQEKVFVLVCLCVLTVSLNSIITTAETARASSSLSTWNFFSRLLYILAATSCTNVPNLDPLILKVLGVRWDWPIPYVEMSLQELERFAEATASVPDTTVRKGLIQEAVKRVNEGRTLQDLPEDEIKLFKKNSEDDGIGPIERALKYTPISTDSLYDRTLVSLPLPTAARAEFNEEDPDGPRYNLNVYSVLEEDPSHGEPQSRLADEPKPWAAQLKNEERKSGAEDKKEEQRVLDSSIATGDDGGAGAADVPYEDSENESDYEAVAGEAYAETDSETDGTDEYGVDNERLSHLEPVAVVLPTPNFNDATELVKSGRGMQVPSGGDDLSAADSIHRLLPDSRNYERNDIAVQKDMKRQWTVPERTKGRGKVAGNAELSTEDEEDGRENDEGLEFEDDEEKDKLMAGDTRAGRNAVDEYGEKDEYGKKLIPDDQTSPRPPHEFASRDMAPKDVPSRMVTSETKRKAVHLSQEERMRISSQLTPAMTRQSEAQVPHPSAQALERLLVPAVGQSQTTERIRLIEEEKKNDTAKGVGRRSSRASVLVELLAADVEERTTTENNSGAASAKAVAPRANAGELVKPTAHFAPLIATGRNDIDHSPGYPNASGIIGVERAHNADTSTVEASAALLHASVDRMSARRTPPPSSKHLSPHASTFTIADVTKSADEPNVLAAAVVHATADIGAAANATEVRTHDASSHIEKTDITERVALDDSFVAVKSVPLLSSSLHGGRMVDATTLVSRSISPAVTVKSAPPLLRTVGSSAAELLIGPFVRRAPSFIGAAAAVPPPASTTAAGLSPTAMVRSPISMGASPAVLVGESPVVAFAEAAIEPNLSEGCKRTTVRERLRLMFEERLEAEVLSAVKEIVAKLELGASRKGAFVQVPRASRVESEEEKETYRTGSEHISSVSATERQLPTKQQGEIRHQTTGKEATPTVLEVGAKIVKDGGVPLTKDTLTKQLKEGIASVNDAEAVAIEATETRGKGSEAETENFAGRAAPVTTYPQAERKLPPIGAGRGGTWQRLEDQELNSATDNSLANSVLTQPSMQQQPQQYTTSSSVASELAKQDITGDAAAPTYPASVNFAPANRTISHDKEPLDNESIRLPSGPPHLPLQQQDPRRPLSFQYMHPTTSDLASQQPPQEQPQRNAYQQNPPLPVRLALDQKQPEKVHDLKEEHEQRQPDIEPSSGNLQRMRDPPISQPERTEETRSEEDTNYEVRGSTETSTPPAVEVELPYQLPHELEKSQPQQSQQHAALDEEEKQQQVNETLLETLEKERDILVKESGALIKEAEQHVPNTEPEEISLWRDIEWRAAAYDRARGVSTNSMKTEAATRCMRGDQEKCLDAMLERHCDSWCTAEAVKLWNGMRPIWTSLHFTPVPAYWNCMKDGLYGLYEQHRPAMEELLLQGLKELNKLRIQMERHGKHLLDFAAAQNSQFQQKYPDLWLVAAWTIAVLLTCRILTGRFFSLLQIVLSATAYTFCCRRRTLRKSEVESAAHATVNALLDDAQIKWLLTQTRKTSFLCECIRGRLIDGSLALPGEADADATNAELAAAFAEDGRGAADGEGRLTGILECSAMNVEAGQRDGTVTQQQQPQISRLYQQMIRQQREMTQALRGVQQRIESVEMGQRFYESKLQETAASHSAMFETSSLQQVDTNFAVLKLIMRLLQKIDSKVPGERVEQLQQTFLAHRDAINETVAAIKARQLRALFGRRRAQSGRETQGKTSATAADQLARIGAREMGPPPPPGVVSTTAISDLPPPCPTAGLSFTVAGSFPPPPTAMHLTASASLSITSEATCTFPYSATAGTPLPPAAAGQLQLGETEPGSLLPSSFQRLDSPQLPSDAFALSAIDKTEKHISWLMRQLCNIQRSLPGLLVQRGEFNVQLVLTRKNGDTCQRIVLSPENPTYLSDSVPKDLGPISAAVDQLFSSDACSAESCTLDDRDIRNSPAATAPDAEFSRRISPAGPQQVIAEEKKQISHDAAAARPPCLAAATPPFTLNAPSNDTGSSKYLPNGDAEHTTDNLREESGAETARAVPAEITSLPPPPAEVTGLSPSKAAREVLGIGEAPTPKPPPKQQAPRRSAAELFAEPAAHETANRAAQRLSLEEHFSPQSRVLSHPAEQTEITPADNAHRGMPNPPKPPFLACPPLSADGPAAPAAPAAFTPHFPPADGAALETESSATAMQLPSPPPSSPTSPRPAPGIPSSLLSSPFTGPAIAAGPPSLSTDIFPLAPDGAPTQQPPPAFSPGGPLSSSMLTSDESALPPPNTSLNALPSLPGSGVAVSAEPSSPFIPGQSEDGNPPLLTALTGVAAAPGILPSPASARSFIAAAAATSAATSPFAHERKGSNAGLFPVTPPPPSPPPFGVRDISASLESRRGSQENDSSNTSLTPPVASIPPPPPSAFPQQQTMNATEEANSVVREIQQPPPPPPAEGTSTTLQPLQYMEGGVNGGITPPLPPPPPTDSLPPPPTGGASASTHFAPPPPPPPPLSQLPPAQNEDGPQGVEALEATYICEGGSLPATPAAFTSSPSSMGPPPPPFCGNGNPPPVLLSVPRRMSGSFRSGPMPAESLAPTKPSTAYQRPSRFQRERREPVKIQAATNPFAVRPPAAGANLQQFGGGGASPSNNAA